MAIHQDDFVLHSLDQALQELGEDGAPSTWPSCTKALSVWFLVA